MSEFFRQVGDYLGHVDWLLTAVNTLVVAFAVVFVVYIPARFLEYHTNQRGVRYIWYVVGSLVLVMVYLCLFGYGRFWGEYSTLPPR